MAIDLEDKSTNSNTLTNNGAAESGDTPFGASTISVDLELGDSDYLTAVDSASLSITGDISIEFWLKLEQLPSVVLANMHIVAKYESGERSYRVFISSGNLMFLQWSSDGSLSSNEPVDTALTSGPDVGEWVHWAATLDVSAQDVKWYRNSSPVASTLADSGQTSIYDSDAIFTVGAHSTVVQFYDGKLDELRIWNDVRTSGEISDNYQSQLTGAEAGLAAYWPFNALAVAATGNFLPLL